MKSGLYGDHELRSAIEMFTRSSGTFSLSVPQDRYTGVVFKAIPNRPTHYARLPKCQETYDLALCLNNTLYTDVQRVTHHVGYITAWIGDPADITMIRLSLDVADFIPVMWIDDILDDLDLQ